MTCKKSNIVVSHNPKTGKYKVDREDFYAEWQHSPSRTVAVAIDLQSEEEAWLWVKQMGGRSIDERNKWSDEDYKAAFKRFKEENKS